MNGSSFRTAGPRPGLRAAVNARLENISFRAGVTAAAAVLAGLAAIAVIVLVTARPGGGSPLAGAWNLANAKAEPTAAAAAPIVAPTAPRSAAGAVPSSRSAQSSRSAAAPAAAAGPGASLGSPASGTVASPSGRHRSGGPFAGRERGWGGFGGFGRFQPGSGRHGGTLGTVPGGLLRR